MQYGYFDDKAREYVITRPDTPQSWSNYLGSTGYGAIITNNAGGYGFYQSGARGRFLRMHFNGVPLDQPGRYIYLRDRQNNDYWSASWQPVGKPLDQYQTTCRHGMGYTVIESRYSGIASETTFFIPLGTTFEYWKVKITNESGRPRDLSAFTFCEFTNQWDTFQDQVNLQYSLFIVRGDLIDDNLLRIAIQDNLTPADGGFFIHDIARHIWMGLIGNPVESFDTSREAFLGPYGSYHAPLAVKRGSCSNSRAYGDNACGSFHTNISLKPGESRELLILMGVGDARTTGRKTLAEFGSLLRMENELGRIKDHWHNKIDGLVIETPDPELNHTINVWGIYNCLVVFEWSRSASLVYNGERDGLGFRDSVQDILGITSAVPEEAGKRLELMLTGQVSSGGALQIVHPFDHHPGDEKAPAPEDYRSDDCLWFFNSIPAYVNETGDLGFYDKILPYADQGEDSVFNHLKRALLFNLERMGKHDLPCGLLADWNDCLKLGFYGESLFVAFQLRLGLTVFADIARLLNNPGEMSWAMEVRDKLDFSIQACAWDGKWFIWAIGEDGTFYGTNINEEGRVYLNTQVWSVISGAATPVQAETCLKTVNEYLATPYGLMLSSPPFIKTPINVMRAVVFNPGVKENAGIFNHTQGWGVMAECMQGNGDLAYQYLRASLPAAYNSRAEIRQCEPYVQAQTTYSPFSPRPGNTRTPWLTGAAAWSYFSTIHYVLGLRPELEGLRIDPCIPSVWKGYSAVRKFRNKEFRITVKNPDAVCKGVVKMRIDGMDYPGNLVPLNLPGTTHLVEVWLGRKL